MTKLLGIRTVYDTDQSKPFRVADVLEAGAILPHSVLLSDLKVCDLEDGDELTIEEEIKSDYYSDYGADYKERNDLYCAGMGC